MLRRTEALSPARTRGAELQALLERVYDNSFDTVYAIALAATGNHADAEDITAETYERVIRGIRSYRGNEERMVSWIHGIARNVVREHHRDRNRHAESIDNHDIEIEEKGSVADQAILGMEASRLLAQLTPAQREVLVLRLSGLKLKEVARSLGKAEGTVKALQFQALQRLKEVRDGE